MTHKCAIEGVLFTSFQCIYMMINKSEIDKEKRRERNKKNRIERRERLRGRKDREVGKNSE